MKDRTHLPILGCNGKGKDALEAFRLATRRLKEMDMIHGTPPPAAQYKSPEPTPGLSIGRIIAVTLGFIAFAAASYWFAGLAAFIFG